MPSDATCGVLPPDFREPKLNMLALRGPMGDARSCRNVKVPVKQVRSSLSHQRIENFLTTCFEVRLQLGWPILRARTAGYDRLYVCHLMVTSHHRRDTASSQSVQLRSNRSGSARLAHARLAPYSSVRPPFQAQVVIALFPDENGSRDDVHRPLDLIETTCDRSEQALPYGFEN